MIHYPSSENAAPLIVVGPQRCGTRFVTNVLNSMPGVTLQGEIENSLMDQVVSLARKTDKIYLNDERRNVRNSWEESKHDFIYGAWTHLAKGKKRKAGSGCLYYGYKSPFHEKYFDFYNAYFHPLRPKYVCCVRSFQGHYFSVKARWPNKHIAWVASRYARSLKRIRYMKESRPDDVLLFFLDEYKEQGFDYLRHRILEPLGLEDAAAAEKRAAKGPANATAQLGLEKRERLSLVEAVYLKLDSRPFSRYAALRRDFG